MMNLDIIQKSNAQLDDFFAKFTPVALFVGATNGVGRNAIKQFAEVTRKTRSRVYFVGRSRERGEQLKSELTAINANGYYEFIAADVSLLASVDDVCRSIKEKEQYLNVLYMSQATTQPNNETAEKLPLHNATLYYSKIRFAVNLLPLMRNGPILKRGVFVFASGLEGKVVTDDLEGRNLPALRNRDSVASMLSLAVDKLSQEAPEISWVHNFPGFVESGIWDGLEGFFGVIIRTIMSIIGRFSYMNPKECGERQIFFATSTRFPSAKLVGSPENGVPLVAGTRPVMSINGEVGGGSYTVDQNGDAVADKVLKRLAEYRTDGTQAMVWKNTFETFQKVTGKERL